MSYVPQPQHGFHEIMQRTRDFMTWLHEYDQVGDLVTRGQVRGKILQARAGLA